jgi:hypothetical protein
MIDPMRCEKPENVSALNRFGPKKNIARQGACVFLSRGRNSRVGEQGSAFVANRRLRMSESIPR